MNVPREEIELQGVVIVDTESVLLLGPPSICESGRLKWSDIFVSGVRFRCETSVSWQEVGTKVSFKLYEHSEKSLKCEGTGVLSMLSEESLVTTENKGSIVGGVNLK